MNRPVGTCTCTAISVCGACLEYAKYEDFLLRKRRWRKKNNERCRLVDRNRYAKTKVRDFHRYSKRQDQNIQWQKNHRMLCTLAQKKSRAKRHGL